MAFLLFWFWKKLWHFKVKDPMLLEQKYKLKWKTPHTLLEKWTLCFSSYKHCESEVKLWWVEFAKEKRVHSLFILSEAIFFIICVLSQCIIFWISLQNIKNYYFIHFCCLFLKSLNGFSRLLSIIVCCAQDFVHPKSLYLHVRSRGKSDTLKSKHARYSK